MAHGSTSFPQEDQLDMTVLTTCFRSKFVFLHRDMKSSLLTDEVVSYGALHPAQGAGEAHYILRRFS